MSVFRQYVFYNASVNITVTADVTLVNGYLVTGLSVSEVTEGTYQLNASVSDYDESNETLTI